MNENSGIHERLAYSVPESAHLIGISPRSLYRLIETGELGTVTLGRRRLVPATELARLVRPQECPA